MKTQTSHHKFTAAICAMLGMLALATAHAQIFVSNSDAGTIGKYNADGSVVNASYITTGANPYGLALDGTDLYVANLGNSKVGKYNGATGATINASLISVGAAPYGLTVGGGYVYVAFYGINDVARFTTAGTGGIDLVFHGALSNPRGVAIDIANNLLYVANFGSGKIGEYNLTTGASINTDFVTGLSGPLYLALDGGGSLFVSNYTGGTIGKYNASTGIAVNASFITLAGVAGIGLDGAGDLFAVSYDGGTVGKYDAGSGAALNASLIIGLTHPLGLAVMPAAIPEPTTCAMGLAALGGFALLRRFRRKSA
ncbi:MAG: PEP-CTERM sorting domain-containing protein [Chthoniobacterales bacterium]